VPVSGLLSPALAPVDFYSAIGRPSIAAEVMLRMLLVGPCFSIRCAGRSRELWLATGSTTWSTRATRQINSTFLNYRRGRCRESVLFRQLIEPPRRR
jgi:hypothetical protein